MIFDRTKQVLPPASPLHTTNTAPTQTNYIAGYTAQLTAVLDDPESNLAKDLPPVPWDPYIVVYDTGQEVHLVIPGHLDNTQKVKPRSIELRRSRAMTCRSRRPSTRTGAGLSNMLASGERTLSTPAMSAAVAPRTSNGPPMQTRPPIGCGATRRRLRASKIFNGWQTRPSRAISVGRQWRI